MKPCQRPGRSSAAVTNLYPHIHMEIPTAYNTNITPREVLSRHSFRQKFTRRIEPSVFGNHNASAGCDYFPTQQGKPNATEMQVVHGSNYLYSWLGKTQARTQSRTGVYLSSQNRTLDPSRKEAKNIHAKDTSSEQRLECFSPSTRQP